MERNCERALVNHYEREMEMRELDGSQRLFFCGFSPLGFLSDFSMCWLEMGCVEGI